jgi:hypothetical protein
VKKDWITSRDHIGIFFAAKIGNIAIVQEKTG